MFNAFKSKDFIISFLSDIHSSGQVLLFGAWNSLLLKSQPISCYPHVDSSKNHIISSKTLFI
jgi:hypothetical protein